MTQKHECESCSANQKSFEDDIIQHGYNATGEYRNIKYSMKRQVFLHWCGYIITPDEELENLNENYSQIFEDNTYNGLTAHNGFDCAHIEDYSPFLFAIGCQKNKTYKDFNFALNIIKRMIDGIYET